MSVVTGLAIDTILYRVAGLERGFSTLNMIVIATIFTVIFTASFSSTAHILNRYIPLRNFKNLAITISINSIVMIVAFFIAAWINGLIYSDLHLLDQDSNIFYLVFGFSVVACVVGNVIYYGYEFYQKFIHAERKRHESQLAALRAQINPHFLFNSLNSIASLIQSQPEEAEEVTQNLAELFRYSLQSSKEHLKPLGEEIESVKKYLAIEKARFGEQLQFTLDIESNLKEVKVPALILQPLVENCVKHGYSQTMEPFHILVKGEKRNGSLRLEVTDSGPGFGDAPSTEILQQGTGLSNIRDRLELQYGARASLTPKGQTVSIELPL